MPVNAIFVCIMERNIFLEILRTARSTSGASTGSWCCTHARAGSSGSPWSSAVIGWQTSNARIEIVSAKYDFIKKINIYKSYKKE
jgi:hypothetical protein